MTDGAQVAAAITVDTTHVLIATTLVSSLQVFKDVLHRYQNLSIYV